MLMPSTAATIEVELEPAPALESRCRPHGSSQLERWRAGHCVWRPPEIGGERGLVLAVLSDAIVCYQRHHAARTPRGRRLFNEARSWLMSDRTDAALSFSLVCDVLGIDVERLREDLRRWPGHRLSTPPRG